MNPAEWDWSQPVVDHLDVHAGDFPLSVRFYETVLAPLGVPKLYEREGEACFTHVNVVAGTPPTTRLHLCFHARSHADVDPFRRARASERGRRAVVHDDPAASVAAEVFRKRALGAFWADLAASLEAAQVYRPPETQVGVHAAGWLACLTSHAGRPCPLRGLQAYAEDHRQHRQTQRRALPRLLLHRPLRLGAPEPPAQTARPNSM